MKKFILNPPWVDTLLEDNWDELASVVGPSMLPFAVTSPPARGGRQRRITVAPGAELGCGHYGCVLATRTPGVVCKITSDQTEVQFVEAAWKVFGRDYPRWPRGIVRYHKIVGLTPPARGGEPLWILWRDEVDHIGHPPAAADDALSVLRFYARQIFMTLAETDEDLAEAKALWRRGAAVEDADELTAVNLKLNLHRALASMQLAAAPRLAVCLEMTSRAIDDLGDIPTVRDALRELLDHDMLLADVHEGNVGRSARVGWVITDPGNFVSLAPRRAARGSRAS